MKVMSYNMLADIYTNEHHGVNLNREHLDFRERSQVIMAEISQSDADIVCLQEMDHYEDVYGPLLESMGYACR